MRTTGPIRALLAHSMNGTTVVLATDSDWIANDVQDISAYTDDIGLESPDAGQEAGFFLWEGEGRLVANHVGEGVYDLPEPEYRGTLRRVSGAEAEVLLNMAPPEPPEVTQGWTAE